MARNRPVSSWMVRTSPSSLPKFHHILKLTGEGRSIKTPLTILTRGFLWRIRVEVRAASVLKRYSDHGRLEESSFLERIFEKNKDLLSDCNSSPHVILTQSKTGPSRPSFLHNGDRSE